MAWDIIRNPTRSTAPAGRGGGGGEGEEGEEGSFHRKNYPSRFAPIKNQHGGDLWIG